MTTLSIRQATPVDDAACARIFLAGRRNAFHWHPEDRFRLEDYADSVADDLVLVAENGGEITGFIAVPQGERVINHLFIDPRYYRQGIGTALLRHTLAMLCGPVVLTCASRNTVARAFYEHNGWQAVNDRDQQAPMVIYRKSLD